MTETKKNAPTKMSHRRAVVRRAKASTRSAVTMSAKTWRCTITAMTALRPEVEPTQPLGELLAVTQSNRLISFTVAAPQKLCTAPAQITGLQPGDQILGIDVRPADGLLYAAGSSGQIYTIRTTADAGFATATRGPMLQTAAGSAQSTSFTGNGFGFDFNPMRDKLRVVSNTGQNLHIDVEAGAVK